MKRTVLFLAILLIICGVGPSPIYGSGTAVVDSYSEANQDSNFDIDSTTTFGMSQGFTGDGRPLHHCKWYLAKLFNPTGNAYAKLYAATGTWGVDLKPTGSALATSNAFDVSTLTEHPNYQLITFNFPRPYKPAIGTHYCLTIEYDGTHSAMVLVGMDQTSPTAPGNSAVKLLDANWLAYANIEFIFYAISDQTYDVPDTTGPSLSITSHSNGQHVTTSSITLAGAASDSGKGDNGIQQVAVNGAQASSGTATGSGTANWSKGVPLNAGANTITVVAYDNSLNHNTTTQIITIYRDADQISAPKLPKGVSTGRTGTFYNFSTGMTSSNLKHPVEYQFDWKGDGISDLSPWGSAVQAKAWTVAGTYQIRAKARYTLQPDIESGWSAAVSVSVNAKPFIHVLSPNGGEAWVVGTTHAVSWESGYLNPAGTVYLFYRYDNAWHPIATLPSTTTSYDWTIPEIPEAITTPAPTGRIKTASIWIGNWLGDGWECWNSSDKAFVILHDAWVFSLSRGDRGGAFLDFQEETTDGTGQFEGYGVSVELGAFGISGAYDFDERGLIHGNYTLFDSYDLANASVLGSGSLTGGLNQQGRLTFNLKTPGGVSLFTMIGNRFFQELVVPKDWTATLTLPRRVKGTLDTLTIEPYQDPNTNEVYPYVFDISASGIIPGHGSIDMEGQVFITLTSIRRGENLAYGTYSSSGYLSETGVLSGTVNLGLGTFNLTATSSSGTKYTLTGKVK